MSGIAASLHSLNVLPCQTQPVDKSGAVSGKEKHTHTSGHIYYGNGNKILADLPNTTFTMCFSHFCELSKGVWLNGQQNLGAIIGAN